MTAKSKYVRRRVPEYGHAVFDRKTGEKVWPAAPNGWATAAGAARQLATMRADEQAGGSTHVE